MLKRHGHEAVLAVLVVGALFILSLQSDRFLTLDNLLNQSRLMAEVALVALPMTFVIISGGIDLSVGSTMGLCAILVGVFWQSAGLPLPAAIALSLVAGLACGLFNGLLIIRFGMPPLIATLGTLALYRGLAEGISQARSVRGYPEWFARLGQGDSWGLPSQVWLVLLMLAICGIVLGLTRWGRTIYAIGSSETAARFAGLSVDATKYAIYAATGFASALAAIVFVSRVSTTRSDMGTGLELDAITAVVLGGTSIFGGRGTILGTALGLILVQTLENGLSLAGVKGDGTVVLIGVVLIVVFSVWLGWFPSIYDTTLRVTDWASFWKQVRQMVMPVFVLALYNAAQISRYMRASMLDNLGQDYVRTARAKGLTERVVVLKHVLRNSLIPVVTVIALGV
ncbi:MAG: ABC transporter permease subunit, partial [Gemmobacter sp.]